MRLKPNAFGLYLLLFFLLLIPGYTLGQSFEWSNTVQSKNYVLSERITTDLNGNIYTLGFFWDTVDVDPGPSVTQFIGLGQIDLYIQKLDSNGKFLWGKHLGSPDYDHPQDIVTDQLGNVYISGNFEDSIDIDPGTNQHWLYSKGHQDGFVVKLDNNGDYVWSIQIGGKSVDGCNSLAIDTASNLVIGGRFAGTVDLNPGLGVDTFTSTGGANAFIEKLDPNGRFLWAKHLPSNHNDLIERIRIDDNNNIYCTGWMLGTTDFDPDTSKYTKKTNGRFDIFICQYDEDGKFNWANTFGGTDNDNVRDMVLDDSNYVYLVGDFEGTVDFDPGTGLNQITSNGRADIFISKFSNTGVYKFTKRIGGTSFEFGRGIGISLLGDLMISGTFVGTVDMDPNAGIANLSSGVSVTNGFILKLDHLGKYKWASALGSAYPMHLTIDDSKNTLVTGYFKDSADVNPNTAVYRIKSTGLNDGFVLKLDGCLTKKSTISPFACKSFTSPSGKYTWTSSGTYYDTLTTDAGCDSILTIELTVEQSNTHELNFGWANETSYARSNIIQDIVHSDSGFIYVTGYFTDSLTVVIDNKKSVIQSKGRDDMYVQKLSSTGQTIWLKTFGSTDYNRAFGIDQDDSGYVYVTGFFSSVIDFDPGTGTHAETSNGSFDVFVLKLNAAGEFVWVKTVGSTYADQAQDITIDEHNNILVTGQFTGTVDFDPNSGITNLKSNNSTQRTGFIWKLTSSGTLEWVKGVGLDDYTFPIKVHLDKWGNIYNVGQFRGKSDFNPGPGVLNFTSAGSDDAYILKLKPNGSFAWAHQLGGPSFDNASAIATDKNGFVYISGTYSDLVDFNPSPAIKRLKAKGGTDGYILRLDSNGYYRWVIGFGGSGSDNTVDIQIDDLGQLYTTGSFVSTVDFNSNGTTPVTLTSTSNNSFLVKHKPDGKLVWAKRITNGALSYSRKLNIAPTGDVILGGYFYGNVDFNPGKASFNVSPRGSISPFVSRLNFIKCCVPTSSVLKLDKCGSFTSPSERYVWTTSGTYYDTILNLSRCDSLIKVELVVRRQEETSLKITSCENYTSPSGKLWSTSGIYRDTLPNAVGCDSTFTIDLTVNKHKRSFTKLSVCNQYESPSGNYLWTSSGKYLDTLQASNGCDSIILIDLTVKRLEHTYYRHHCGPVTSPSGKYTWTTDGAYLDTIVDAGGPGCDSFYRFNLTFGKPSSERISVANCLSYTSPSGRHTWTTSGTYYDTIVNSSKCDSFLTIDLTILESTTGIINPRACYAYTSPSGRHQWTKSGTYYDTLTSDLGCDSFLTINLTILEPSYFSTREHVCFEYTSPSGKYTWSQGGIYHDTIPNAAGCDSVIKIDLTIKTVDTGVTQTKNMLVSNVVGGYYQWLNCNDGMKPIEDAINRTFYAKSVGKYAVSVRQNGCTDTSRCIEVNELSSVRQIDHSIIQFYPNPNSGSFIINHKNKILNKIHVFSANGALIQSYEVNGSSTHIDLKLTDGIYFIRGVGPIALYQIPFIVINDL